MSLVSKALAVVNEEQTALKISSLDLDKLNLNFSNAAICL